MIDENDSNDKRKDETEGKGRAGGSGRGGRAGGAAGGVIDNKGVAFSVDASKLKEIMANWRRMNAGEAISAFVEFVAEGTLRASANLLVKFDSPTKAGFAVVSQAVKFGIDVVGAMRNRSRDAAVAIRRKYGLILKIKRGGQTIIAPNPTVS